MNAPATLTPDVSLSAIDNLFNIVGQKVFVPGGYGALGEAICWGFARHGAQVAIAGPDIKKAERLADKIRSHGGIAKGFSLNAADVQQVQDTTDEVATTLGGIDTLINCVGISLEQRLLDVTPEVFDKTYEINLRAAMFLGQAVARHQIKAENGGCHIHLLSDRGYSAYCATKGALVMIVKQHAMELAPYGITVNGVAPTFIQSDRIRKHLEREGFKDFILERNPLGRIGDPVEVVGQIITLAAPAGKYITGQVVYIDGGVTASQ
jgi:NAD(P)-dependent dehydrogenase (short-subunit alcohol dehydrogenase family)